MPKGMATVATVLSPATAVRQFRANFPAFHKCMLAASLLRALLRSHCNTIQTLLTPRGLSSEMIINFKICRNESKSKNHKVTIIQCL